MWSACTSSIAPSNSDYIDHRRFLLYDPIIGKIVFLNISLPFMPLAIDEITYFISNVFSCYVSIFILLTLLFS